MRGDGVRCTGFDFGCACVLSFPLLQDVDADARLVNSDRLDSLEGSRAGEACARAEPAAGGNERVPDKDAFAVPQPQGAEQPESEGGRRERGDQCAEALQHESSGSSNPFLPSRMRLLTRRVGRSWRPKSSRRSTARSSSRTSSWRRVPRLSRLRRTASSVASASSVGRCEFSATMVPFRRRALTLLFRDRYYQVCVSHLPVAWSFL